MPRPGIIQSSVTLSIQYWTRDLQIFSLTLSQLSYLGKWWDDVLRYIVLITATRSMEFEKFIFDESAFYPFPTLSLISVLTEKFNVLTM